MKPNVGKIGLFTPEILDDGIPFVANIGLMGQPHFLPDRMRGGYGLSNN